MAHINAGRIVKQLSERWAGMPETRQVSNAQKYEMKDAAMSAMGVFYTQCPSFLARQRDMTRHTCWIGWTRNTLHRIMNGCMSNLSKAANWPYRKIGTKKWVSRTFGEASLQSGVIQHALSQEIELAAAIHAAFDQLEPVDLSFHLAGTPVMGGCCPHGIEVFEDVVGK